VVTLAATADQGPWTADLSVRAANVILAQSQWTLPGTRAEVHRLGAAWTGEAWKVRAGDFTAVLGRGLLLSVVRNEALLRDWSLRGARVVWQEGPWEAQVLVGRADNGLGRLPSLARTWSVAGLEASLAWKPGHRVGIRVCALDDLRVPARMRSRATGRRLAGSLSLSGSLLGGLLDYYGEGALVRYQDPPLVPPLPGALDPGRGRGAYGALTWARGPWMLQAEAKHYRRFDLDLNQPPVADRETEKGTLDVADGARLYGQRVFRDAGLTLFLSLGRYRQGRLTSAAAWRGSQAYGGFRLEGLGDALDASLTHGVKTVHEAGAYPERRTEAALTWRFTPAWSLALTFDGRANRPPDSAPYREDALTLEGAWVGRGALRIMRQSGTRSPGAPFGGRDLYSGGLRLELGRESHVDLSGGRWRGGEACSGGQCAILPPFEGWRLEARFAF
ncbi:MAG TPA: hypothetical protein VK188_03530, partial [Holophaga sp.]|nr:hypothetical protein [Holophaga sp.]